MTDGQGEPHSTGLPIAVRRHGPTPDAGGHAYVLVHGFGGSAFTWRTWAPRLARRGPTYVVELTGFGEAPKPAAGPYHPRAHAERILALAHEVGLGSVTLVGHSMGGGIALLSALLLQDDPEIDVRAMGLVASAAYPQRMPPFVGLSRHPKLSTKLAQTIGVRRIVHATLRSIVFDPDSITDDQIEAYTRPLEADGGLLAVMATGRSILPDDIEDLMTRYPTLTMPTLVLWGDRDRVVPLWVGERLARELPRAELHVLPRCGHVPPEEQPEASFAVFEDFLSRFEDGPA